MQRIPVREKENDYRNKNKRRRSKETMSEKREKRTLNTKNKE